MIFEDQVLAKDIFMLFFGHLQKYLHIHKGYYNTLGKANAKGKKWHSMSFSNSSLLYLPEMAVCKKYIPRDFEGIIHSKPPCQLIEHDFD
jgi:hypothetical protein